MSSGRIARASIMTMDLEKYRKYVDHFDITEAQKVDLIHTVARILESVIDRAFGLHPDQQCLEKRREENSMALGNALRLPDQSELNRTGGQRGQNTKTSGEPS